MTQEKTYIYGKHPVSEALRNAPHTVVRVFLSPHIEDRDFKNLITKTGVLVAPLSPQSTPFLEKDAVHQGVAAEISLSGLMRPYREFVDSIEINQHTALVLLGEIQDPQNVGAIIRSAAAFGIAGVLIPEHQQAPVTGHVVKVSAGMAFRVPLVSIGNVNTTVRDLKERGFWIYGLDETAVRPLAKEVFDAPTLFILGNEAKGIREKTRELCDVLVSIPMNPECESLNVAASAAVTLYAWSSEHPEALTAKKISKE